MRRAVLLALTASALTLGGCQKQVGSPAGGKAFSPKGRFVGIGLYTPGQMWLQLTRAMPADPAVASLNDDEQVIVVLDSKTGEVRQCGNLSGHCLAMNPWSKPVAAAQQAPARVLKHRQQLWDEAEAHRKGLDVELQVKSR